MTEFVADLHDADGRVAIPGFYDAVLELTDAERIAMDALPYDEAEFRRHAAGAPQ